MHPFMALWLWSMTMSRIGQTAAFDAFGGARDDPSSNVANISSPTDVRAGDYLRSDLVSRPLPGILLDKLADLYWAERDSELAI